MNVLVLVIAATSWADGGLALAEVEDLVRFRAAEFAACRSRGAADCVVRLGVSADGGVDSYSVITNGRGDTGVCVNKVLRGWAFPPREAATMVQLGWSPRAPRTITAVGPNDGGLSFDQLLVVQLEHKEEIARCYVLGRRIATNDGIVSVETRLGPSGVVLSAVEQEPTTRLLGTDVARCATDVVRGWRFPEAKVDTMATLEWIVADTAERTEALKSDEHPHAALVTAKDTQAAAAVHPKSELGRALEKQLGTLTECAPVEGLVSLSIDVRRFPDGPPELALHSHETHSDELRTCVMRVASAWSLPAVKERQFDLLEVEVSKVPRLAPKPLPHHDGLDKDVIMKVIKAHQAEVKFCYEAELQKQKFEGKVAVAWTIGAFGDVVKVDVLENTSPVPQLGTCIRNRVARWKFPGPVGGGLVDVTFPWIFKAAGE